MRIDATPLAPGLSIGAAPPSVEAVTRAGYTTLVLAAREIQPPDVVFAGKRLRVIRVPLDDNPFVPLAPRDLAAAHNAALAVGRRIRRGERVLVTCAQGRNRSGLVSALALHVLYGWDGRTAVAHVRQRRMNALTNPQFVTALQALRARAA